MCVTWWLGATIGIGGGGAGAAIGGGAASGAGGGGAGCVLEHAASNPMTEAMISGCTTLTTTLSSVEHGHKRTKAEST